jgi:hypothetical protein
LEREKRIGHISSKDVFLGIPENPNRGPEIKFDFWNLTWLACLLAGEKVGPADVGRPRGTGGELGPSGRERGTGAAARGQRAKLRNSASRIRREESYRAVPHEP